MERILIDISLLAQITEETYTKDTKSAIKRLNATISYANANTLHIKYPKLDLH